MTVPSYTEDLTDITLADETSGWTESSDTAWDDQGPPAYNDQDYAYIQGNASVTADTTKTGVGTLMKDYGSTFTIPTDGAMLIWLNFYNPNALASYANGGLRAMIGSSDSVFWSWDVGGSDYGSYPYGGWQNFAVNDTVSPDDTVGSYAGGSHQFVGGGCNVVTGIGKGESFQVDAIRVGRCSSIFEYGETADYATIAGFAAQNDNTSNRWGLIQAVPGGYLWKGRMQLGSASNAVDFRDSNVLVFIQDTPKVTANFNTIEILNASSNVEMTGFQFICLDPSNTASKGRWITTNDATVDLTNCTFVDMNTFVFDSNTTIDGCVFRRCGEITQGGGDFDNCTFDESPAATALLVDNPDNVDNCTFNSDGNGHAIELTSACAGNSYTLTDFWVSGYAASDGSTGDEAIFNDSGGAVTINIDGGSGVSNISVRNGTGASTTLVANYSFTVTGLESGTEVTIVTSGTSTVLHHTESASTSDGDGKYQITYSHSGGASVDVLIHHIDYKPDISNIYGLTLPSTNSSAKVKQFADENYENP